MPAVIMFGSLRGDQESAGDKVKVQEDPETVAKALAESSIGFARFHEVAGEKGAIWVNPTQVRAIRDPRGSSGAVAGSGSEEEGL